MFHLGAYILSIIFLMEDPQQGMWVCFAAQLYCFLPTLLLERWVHAVWSAMDTTAGRGVLEINSAHVVSFLNPFF